MKDLKKFSTLELNKMELQQFNGGGFWAIALAVTTISFAYTLGKDSYDIHPQSLI